MATAITAPKFDFSPPRPRPFLASLPARIDEYELATARFFQWKTGMNYYFVIDKIVDFVINLGRSTVVDLLADTATFALRLAGRAAFTGQIYSFDSNIALLERAQARAARLELRQKIEFRQFLETRIPLADAFAETAVSIFDLQRHPPAQYLGEIWRILQPGGTLVMGVYTERSVSRARRLWRKVDLHFLRKNPIEAGSVYPEREMLIRMLFATGFRQIIIEELNVATRRRPGVCSLIAVTK